LRALTEQVVDRAADHLLIARNRSCRKNYGISRLNAHEAVILVSDTCQGRSWLSLTSGTHEDDLLWMELIDIFSTNERPLRDIQVAKFYRHLHVVDHAAPNQRDKTIV